MPATRVRAFRVIPFVAFLLAACGDDPSNPDIDTGTGNPPGEEIAAEVRVAALEEVEEAVGGILAQDIAPAEQNAAIAAYLETRAEFRDVGVDTETSTVWAVFTDGRGLIIPNNLTLGMDTLSTASGRPALRAGDAARVPAGSAVPAGPAPSRAYAAAAVGDPAELPHSRKARLLSTFPAGYAFGDEGAPVRARMAEMLDSAGWEVTSGGADMSTVAALRSVAGDGFFYFNTHGSAGEMYSGARMPTFALQTSSVVTAAMDNDPQMRADFVKHRLVYMTADYGGSEADSGTVDTRYAITPEFVLHYMEFSQNSVIIFAACFSTNPTSEPTEMVNAFRAKGASVVIGWTKKVNAWDAWHMSMFLVDRMTGANLYEPEPSAHRPFPLQPVLDYMHELGIDESNDGVLRVVGPTSGAGFGLLRPTIERIQIDTAASAGGTLKIYGSFGSDPGAANRSVYIRDNAVIPLDVIAWTPDSIRVRPIDDKDAAGFSGDVVVVSRQRESNPRRLYAWQGTTYYRLDSSGSLQLEINADFVGRFDPDSVRSAPGDAAVANTHPQVFRVNPRPEVEARFTASGSAPTPDGCTMTWSGAGAISSADSTAERYYVFDARLDPAERELDLRQMIVLDTEGLISSCDASFAGPVVFTALMFAEAGAASLTVQVDEQWHLQAREWSFTSGEGGAVFRWPAASPSPAYDPTLPN